MTDASSALTRHYAEELDAIRAQGLFKSERIITSPQSAEITLEDGRVVARRAGGRQLKTEPKALRDSPEVDRLKQLAEWLDRHAASCVAQVDAWMVSSLPVPTELIARVWPDEAWQSALRDMAVAGGLGKTEMSGGGLEGLQPGQRRA